MKCSLCGLDHVEGRDAHLLEAHGIKIVDGRAVCADPRTGEEIAVTNLQRSLRDAVPLAFEDVSASKGEEYVDAIVPELKRASLHYAKEESKGVAPSAPVLNSGLVTVPIKTSPNLSLVMSFGSQAERDRYKQAIDATITRLQSPPRWSTTPPTEPGVYWMRTLDGDPEPDDQDPRCVARVFHLDGVGLVYEPLGGVSNFTLRERPDTEWWSERVQEPQ